jgi:glucokinase
LGPTPSRHIGVDLGGTNIKWVAIEIAGGNVAILASDEIPTNGASGPANVAQRVAEAAGVAQQAAGAALTLGVGLPGKFDPARGTVTFLPNIAGDWNGVELARIAGEGVGLRCLLINDARAFALAEHAAGGGRGCRNLLGITLGTGIGGGIIIDGRLHLGIDGSAGEFGHQTVLLDGPVCGCGMLGCVEALAKSACLAALAEQPTARAATEAAKRGDATALAAFETVAGWLAIAIANAIVLLSPDRIVLGGGGAQAGDLLLEPLRGMVRERVTMVPVERVKILQSELGPTAGAIGAALWGAGVGH